MPDEVLTEIESRDRRIAELESQLAASQELEKELLEALKLAREVIDEECSCDMCVRLASTVNAAIAKAEGKQPGCDCHKHERQVCNVCQGVTGREGKTGESTGEQEGCVDGRKSQNSD